MKFNDANDVTKALAAFGAPSIRYHSFGPGKVRPSSKVVQRSDAKQPQVLRPNEPHAAPVPHLIAAPVPPPADLPASLPVFRRTVDPASVAPRAAPVMPIPPPRVVNDQLFRSFNTVTAFIQSPAPLVTQTAAIAPSAGTSDHAAPVTVAPTASYAESPRGTRSLADIFALLAVAPG